MVQGTGGRVDMCHGCPREVTRSLKENALDKDYSATQWTS